MEALDLNYLQYQTYGNTWKRGEKLAASNAIHNISIEENHNKSDEIIISAKVSGSYLQPYNTELRINTEINKITQIYCDCEAFHSYSGACKHCVALAIKINKMQLNNEIDLDKVNYHTDHNLYDLLHRRTLLRAQPYLEGGIEGVVELEPIFQYENNKWSVEFKIGTDKKYVVKNISELVDRVNTTEYYSYGKKLAFIHTKTAFTETSQKIFDFLKNYTEDIENAINGSNSYYYQSAPALRYIMLSDESLIRLLEILKNEIINVGKHRATICTEAPQLFSKIDEIDNFWKLTLPFLVCIKGSNQTYLFMDNIFYRCPKDFPEPLIDLLSLCSLTKNEFKIEQKDLPAFCSTFMPSIESSTFCTKSNKLEDFLPNPCNIQFYLDHVKNEYDEFIVCEVYGCYGETKYNLFLKSSADDFLNRDIIKEVEAVQMLSLYFPYSDSEQVIINWDDEESIYKLLSTGLNQLRQIGEVYLSTSMRKLIISKPPKISVGVSLNVGLLDIDIDTNRFPSDELAQLLNSYQQRKKFYRLNNGSFVQLEDSSLSTLAELSDGLELNSKQLAEGHLQIPKYNAFYINQILKENESEINVTSNYDYRQIIRNMKNIENSDFELPSDLKTELRPYQKFGYQWLRTLDNLGFGGILADDMGLGKTVQIITFLLAKAKEAQAENKIIKALIVCPASLVYNWESEIHRFAPFLSVCTIVGSTEQRKELISRQGQYDVTLTSYDLLKRDLDCYDGCQYDYEIIDEAQNIKNHTTQACKAVKSIQAATRFALTGTPIENSLSELWSIFDYLMPGLLGSYPKFKKKYETPIIANDDDTISKRLQKMVKPFILRRLKKDVLKELPDKIEKVILARMEDEQERIYVANAQRVRESLAEKSEDEFKTNRIQILAELTKLRQLCCDPSLVYQDYHGGSAKLDACMELVSSAVDAGNKILIFSQFTTMLDIIKKQLDTLNIDAFMLTGSTSKEKRRELVDKFNKDETPVFLISLKAGGTGLNLTAASIVIHFDPWWNLAAQNQATDRTHRIGQEQVVTVYKLLVKDTIEEKIEKLQEKKAQLSDQIISEGGITQNVMNKEDFMDFLSTIEE